MIYNIVMKIITNQLIKTNYPCLLLQLFFSNGEYSDLHLLFLSKYPSHGGRGKTEVFALNLSTAAMLLGIKEGQAHTASKKAKKRCALSSS